MSDEKRRSGDADGLPGRIAIEFRILQAGPKTAARAELRNLEAFMQKHQFKPVVDKVYPLSQLEAALTQLRTGQFMGKIVVTL